MVGASIVQHTAIPAKVYRF